MQERAELVELIEEEAEDWTIEAALVKRVESLSHTRRVSSHLPNKRTVQSSSHKKHVRFSSCTTDITASLLQRYACSNRIHSRPILKFRPAIMSGYLRTAGSAFARALAALGAWCTGVTSENPNVRGDHYKQIVAQIRGSSTHLKEAAEAALYQNVHGLWMQLVEDFSMRRQEYASADNLLYCHLLTRLI
jgi:hypothetical protein